MTYLIAFLMICNTAPFANACSCGKKDAAAAATTATPAGDLTTETPVVTDDGADI